MSASVAVLVTVNKDSSLKIGRASCRERGEMLGALTTMVNELVGLRFWALMASGLESVTMVIKVLVLGRWVSVGVQVMMPPVEMLALVTAPATEVTDKV